MESGKRLQVGVREAKARLTQLIGQVRRGAVVDITHRGRQVAQMIPFPRRHLPREEVLRVLEERGMITGALKRPPRTLRPLRLVPMRDLQAVLRSDRDRY